MDRRQILKLLGSTAILPAFHTDFFNSLHSIHTSLPAAAALKTLTAHQNATISAMADLIIPRTETPGAVDARVPEFIDSILSDWYDDRDRVHFLQGLAAVDKMSRQKFGKDFVDNPTNQQTEILRLLGEEMSREISQLASGPRGYHGTVPDPQTNFYFMFRRLVLTGYFTSEAGATRQLHFEVIPNHPDPCAPLAGEKSLAAKHLRPAK